VQPVTGSLKSGAISAERLQHEPPLAETRMWHSEVALEDS
jgi:hypothetical protein